MNRKEVSRKHIAALIVAFIVILTAVAGFSAVQTIHNTTVRNRLTSQFETVPMPASLRLESKHYNGRAFWDDSPGTSESMVYKYVPASTALTVKQAHDAIAGNFEAAGYSVNPETNDPVPIGVSANGNGVHFSITINGKNGSTAAAPLEEVQVQVYE